jgi:hypothetical protein
MNLSKSTWVLTIILSLTIIGAWLRIENINQPINGDLAGMLFMHFSTSWDSLLLNYIDTNQWTLYIFLAKLFLEIFGDNEFALRLPEFLAGVFVIPLIYKVGLLVTNSRLGALITAFLLTFSSFHLYQSNVSKGYLLTVFFASLVVFITYKLLGKEHFTRWGILFFLTGLGMILLVPSNVHFLTGIAVFYVFVIFKNYKNYNYTFHELIKLMWPVILLFSVIVGYCLNILSDLRRGIAGECSVPLNCTMNVGSYLERLIEFFSTFISPWSSWFYLFLLFGLVRLYKTKEFALFISLFVIPNIINLVSGSIGPARVYIYWLPFILLLIGFGVAEFLVWVQARFSNLLAYSVGAIILIIIIFYPIKFYSVDFSKEGYRQLTTLKDKRRLTHVRLMKPGYRQLTTLKDAKAAKVFIEKNTSEHDLIVVPYFDLVLRHYVEEIIAHKMLNIIQSGKLEKIIYLGSSETPPHKFPNVGGISRTNFMKDHSFNLIHKFDTLSIYDLGLSIRKFSHPNGKGDYENETQFNYNKSTKVEHINQPTIEGSKALKITKQSNQVSTLRSKKIGSVDISKDNSYILTSFARGYEELSQVALLHPINKNPSGIILLNIYSGIFTSYNSNFLWKRIDPYKHLLIQPERIHFTWELVFTIYPVTKGKLNFKTGIRSQSPVGHFDGFQSFILEPKDTNN